METQFDLKELPAGDRPAAWISIGNFDGVHRGHRRLLERLTTAAREANAAAVVVTFEPHPRCVLMPDECPQGLTTLDEKVERLDQAGVDRLVVISFTRELSHWSAETFLDELRGGFDIRGLVVGPDFALGHRRRGDIPFLIGYGARHGFEVVVADAISDGGDAVSSSRIRIALLNGDMADANRMLGHEYFLDGHVEYGDRLGTTLGFPTANLSITANKCLPLRGIYAMWVKVQGQWHPAATSLGFRPTFGGDRLTFEAFLLDFDRDIYREPVRGAFVERLREERTYADVEALTAQIARDVEQTRRILADHSAPADL